MGCMQGCTDNVEDPVFLQRLRVVSLIEGCSTLVLFFIAMPMKYMMDMPQAVSWPGRIHGGLFMLLIVLAIIAIKRVPMPPQLSGMLIVAAVIPFGPFLVDKRLKALHNG
jgi:integral membrane protein